MLLRAVFFTGVICGLGLLLVVAADKPEYIPPFSSDLALGGSGDAVYVLQVFLSRMPNAPVGLSVSGKFDGLTTAAIRQFQSAQGLPVTGIADVYTQNLLYKMYEYDGYHDDLKGTLPDGILYKVHVPVRKDRSVEVQATLYDRNMAVLHTFTVRAKGQANLTQFASNGNTPSGLMSLDLNSPESDPQEYGPYPVNRAVAGIDGNARFTVPNVRNGILLHTGEWQDWDPSKPMPDSHGCLHAHPQDIYDIWQILTTKVGVQVHNNTFGKMPYPYKTQGLLSVECVDC
eukprot:ANDGO_03379.mRNA.1 hypothetical protein DFA_11980